MEKRLFWNISPPPLITSVPAPSFGPDRRPWLGPRPNLWARKHPYTDEQIYVISIKMLTSANSLI